jgi:polysaccharide deacetylase family protein (PEP-CTERM system associated)
MPAPVESRRPPSGLFTVDVEDWFHPLIKDPAGWDACEDRIERPTYRLLEILEETGNRGTFFVLGWVAERHPQLVRAIESAGHEVGCHGHHHLSLAHIGPDRFRDDLRRALDALGTAGARQVVSFRAPYFSIDHRTEWALPILAEHGLRVDSSLFPLKLGYYGHRGSPNLPHRRGEMFEFPITLPELAGCRVPVTGGFYSRFFPTSWSVAGARRVAERGAEPMFYVHPWELDADQPRLRVGRFLTWRHYLRLERTEPVVGAILRGAKWRSLRESWEERGRP